MVSLEQNICIGREMDNVRAVTQPCDGATSCNLFFLCLVRHVNKTMEKIEKNKTIKQ